MSRYTMPLLIMLLLFPASGNASTGDVNGDGVVSVADVFYLINNLFAGDAAPVRQHSFQSYYVPIEGGRTAVHLPHGATIVSVKMTVHVEGGIFSYPTLCSTENWYVTLTARDTSAALITVKASGTFDAVPYPSTVYTLQVTDGDLPIDNEAHTYLLTADHTVGTCYRGQSASVVIEYLEP